MARNSKIDRLQSVELFSALTSKELAQIARACDEVPVDAGTAVVVEGSTGSDFCLIVEGEAAVTRAGSEVATLRPGQYFGELALLDAAPRNATVTARTPMVLLVLAHREFSALLDAWPGVAHKMLALMARRLRQADAEALSN